MSKYASKVICVSDCTWNDELEGGIKRNRLRCIPTGIDSQYYLPLETKRKDEIRSTYRIKKQEYIVGFVGRICQEKGILQFLEITKNICLKLPLVKIIIVGEGPLLNYAKSYVKQNKLKDRYLFTGFVKDVRPAIGIFDVLLSATTYESLSMVLMQAMSMKIPVVTRDIWDNHYLIDNKKTGLLFRDEDNLEISNMVINLLKDIKIRNKITSEARRKIITVYSEKVWIDGLSATLNEK